MQRRVLKTIPNCIGIIPDGNRRWAKEHHFPSIEGHRRGEKKIREALSWCREVGIKNVVVYAFSTENWGRPEKEIIFLKRLFLQLLGNLEKHSAKLEEFSFHFIGQVEKFGAASVKRTRKLEEETRGRKRNLFVAISYGGRAELLDACTKLVKNAATSKTKNFSEQDLLRAMWSRDVPDIDLVIRTGKETRLSNFFPWQSGYSELFFVRSYWPAFCRKEFDCILDEYGKRRKTAGK